MRLKTRKLLLKRKGLLKRQRQSKGQGRQLREDHITEHIVPTLIKACGDKVPNVQFCASKIIKEHRSRIATSCMQDVIIPKLRENMQDTDKDVAHYAKLAAEDL